MRLPKFIACCFIILLLAAPACALKIADLPAEKEKALAGDSLSQVNVGDYYYARNEYAAALPWYQMAAKQGRIDARQRIAYMYETGQGVPQDIVKAYVLKFKIRQHYNLYPDSEEYYDRYLQETAARFTPEQAAEAARMINEPWQF